MKDAAGEIAAWASLLGSIVALLGLFQSHNLLVLTGAACLGTAIISILYARYGMRRLATAGLVVEGVHLDCLNIANLRRRQNRSLIIQEAYHFARIEGSDLEVAWKYDGFCNTEYESAMEFSIDAENTLPFEQMKCVAYDLKEDPNRLHEIRPILIGGDGLSKKVSVPFLRPLSTNDYFSILLRCILPDCVGSGIQYYTSTLSFAQKRVARLVVHLMFVGERPEWVRVYTLKAGRAFLSNEIRPFKNDGQTCEYLDEIKDASGESIRVYLYRVAGTSRYVLENTARRIG